MLRRAFLSSLPAGTALVLSAPSLLAQNTPSPTARRAPEALPRNESDHPRYRPPHRFGLGGAIALGDMRRQISAAEAQAILDTAWEQGIRYYDTSPWYGLGLSERRLGQLLYRRELDSYVLSSKTGRLLEPASGFDHPGWQGIDHFRPRWDFSAAATRRSIEDSLQRLGVPRLDVVFIHDLSPGHMGEQWREHFEVARKGAMPELVKMREEGLIKGWGLGVNTLEPLLATLEVSDPDIFLLATQYSLLKHDDALTRAFPACEGRDVSLVLGAPLNSGYLAGGEYYNYERGAPQEIADKRERYRTLARKHGVDLRTAALQFCNAPRVVAAVIPGASSPEQVRANVASMVEERVPDAFWQEAKAQGLMHEEAPTPT
jgi:D-threo-aldose 1-dehydrogenase